MNIVGTIDSCQNQNLSHLATDGIHTFHVSVLPAQPWLPLFVPENGRNLGENTRVALLVDTCTKTMFNSVGCCHLFMTQCGTAQSCLACPAAPSSAASAGMTA
jgi:hypothetical protein